MMHLHCTICNDKNKFRMALNEVENINGFIKRRIPNIQRNISYRNLDKESLKLSRLFKNDKKHIHYMCGHCHMVNEMELRNAEDEMYLLAIAAIKAYKESAISKQLFYDIKRLFQGDYPLICREMIKVLRTHKVDESVNL